MTIGRGLISAIAIVALIGSAKAADADDVVAGLAWGDSSILVHSKLNEVCDGVIVIDAEPIQFPLAGYSEKHFLCSDMALPTGAIASSVFVVADDQLKMIEARGGALRTLIETRDDKPMEYLDYQVFDQGELIANPEKDSVWFLSKEALHPNLFTWSNPYLDVPDEAAPIYNKAAKLPALIEFGAGIETLKPQFEAACPIMNIQEIEDVWLPHGPEKQTQVNCFGFEYAGFPRKFEAVFGDGVLELVWILTGKQEEDRIRDALIEAFGASEHVSEGWEVFKGGQVSLRKDKPEILVVSEKLVPFYAEQTRGE